MSDLLPRTLKELEHAASALDAELTQSLTLLRHLERDLRPETIAAYARRTTELESVVRKIGLAFPNGAPAPSSAEREQ